MHGGLSTGPRTDAGRAVAVEIGRRNLARVNAARRATSSPES